MDIDRFIDALNASGGLRDIRDVGVELVESVGGDYFLYAGIGQTPISSPEVTIIGNYPEEWLHRYQEKDYARIDPTVWHATQSVTPLYWCDIGKEDSVTYDFFQDAYAHGIVSGVTIPLHSGVGYSAILTFVSSNDDPSVYDAFHSEISNLLLFGYHMHKNVMRCINVPSQSVKQELLSELERNCLLWAAEGKTAWEISEILSLKERTVVFHLNNAVKKLGATNRQHAIAYAIALGEVRSNIVTMVDKYIFK